MRLKDDRLQMRWFRKHIGHGAWLALVALAINFSMAFGHVHAFGGIGSKRGAALVAAIASPDGGQSQNHPTDNQADYLCPICVAAIAMGNALVSTPPALRVEFGETSLDRAIQSDVLVPQPPRAAFQPRGPPIS
jgi:hypothetical protein